MLPTTVRALLVGSSETTTTLINDIQTEPHPITIIGIVVEAHTPPQRLNNIPILGAIAETPQLIKQHAINLIIIAIQEIKRTTLEFLIDNIPPGTVTWKITPDNTLNPSVAISYKKLRNLQAEDLIGRRNMAIATSALKQSFKDKTILITGAGGSIGSELVKIILSYPVKVILAIARSERSLYTLQKNLELEYEQALLKEKLLLCIADINDISRMQEIARAHTIDIILHAAAHKHVPLMETHEKEAIKNNVFATHKLLKIAHEHHIKNFIFISTDKAVAPQSIMGASKKLAEYLILKYTDYYNFTPTIVRLGNVIGSQGSVVPLFNKQIRLSLPVTVTNPKTKRYFMTLTEAALLITTISTFALAPPTTPADHTRRKIYILKMGEPIVIDTLVRRMIRLHGLLPDRDVKIAYTGIRPGEKLEEVLYDENSTVIPTSNPYILQIKEDHITDIDTVWETILTLEENIANYTPAAIRSVLKKLKILNQ
ncbi:UDP-N-acetyl-alpha-D-glucosamine C6 dehydratase [Spirochaetota bacterium]|nr:UDP-N-acetyl-alpha-D-glucosamine C6 dehydratase [Spirochaetota bacterium]